MVTAYVSEVIDGDTFKTSKGNIIRLSGVNASERGTPYSKMAADKLSSLLLRKTVVYKERARDNYGRIVADVYLNSLYINKVMNDYIVSITK